MTTRLNSAQRDALTDFVNALDTTADSTRGSVRTTDTDADFTLAGPGCIRFAAAAIRAALQADDVSYDTIHDGDQLRRYLCNILDNGVDPTVSVLVKAPLGPHDGGAYIPLGTLADALADAAGDPHLRPANPRPDSPHPVNTAGVLDTWLRDRFAMNQKTVTLTARNSHGSFAEPIAVPLSLLIDAHRSPTTPTDDVPTEVKAIGRTGVGGFLTRAARRGHDVIHLRATGSNTHTPETAWTTHAVLESVLTDANWWTHHGSTRPCDHDDAPSPDNDGAIIQNTTDLINWLPASARTWVTTITARPLGGTNEYTAHIDIDVLRDLAAVADTTSEDLKPTDIGVATSPDPYGIDLRGPTATINNADRAIHGGLDQLNARDRAIFTALLRLALTNLDRTAPVPAVETT